MLSVRLPKDLEYEVDRLANQENPTKTQIICKALEQYVNSKRNQQSSFELGEELFGKYGSGEGNRSVDYKRMLKEKIREKSAR